MYSRFSQRRGASPSSVSRDSSGGSRTVVLRSGPSRPTSAPAGATSKSTVEQRLGIIRRNRGRNQQAEDSSTAMTINGSAVDRNSDNVGSSSSGSASGGIAASNRLLAAASYGISGGGLTYPQSGVYSTASIASGGGGGGGRVGNSAVYNYGVLGGRSKENVYGETLSTSKNIQVSPPAENIAPKLSAPSNGADGNAMRVAQTVKMSPSARRFDDGVSLSVPESMPVDMVSIPRVLPPNSPPPAVDPPCASFPAFSTATLSRKHFVAFEALTSEVLDTVVFPSAIPM